MWCCEMLCGVVSVKLQSLYGSCTSTSNVTECDRLLEPFSGSEVQ